MLDFTDMTIDDIQSEHMQLVAEKCGISDAISLMSHVPGLELYIPLSGRKTIIKRYIKLNYNGSNASSLAVKLGVDQKYVLKIVKKLDRISIDSNFLQSESMIIVAKECGEQIALRLMQELPMSKLYVPKSGFILSIRKYIERNYNGFNSQTLALKCNVTERFVRKVAYDKDHANAQLSLFS